MPTERRNMTATFVKNKLILVGGLGHEIKSSVDIYDIYTGDFIIYLYNMHFINTI